jgi:hypothetical protein
MEEQALRAYHRRTLAADALIGSTTWPVPTGGLCAAPSALCLLAPSARTRWPSVAQGEEQLGQVECPLAGRGADHAIERSNAG